MQAAPLSCQHSKSKLFELRHPQLQFLMLLRQSRMLDQQMFKDGKWWEPNGGTASCATLFVLRLFALVQVVRCSESQICCMLSRGLDRRNAACQLVSVRIHVLAKSSSCPSMRARACLRARVCCGLFVLGKCVAGFLKGYSVLFVRGDRRLHD